jgi:hypothetical protein
MKRKKKPDNKNNFKTLDSFLDKKIETPKKEKKKNIPKDKKDNLKKLKDENENLKQKIKALENKQKESEKPAPEKSETNQIPKLVIASNKQYSQQFDHYKDIQKGSGFDESHNN